MICDVITRCGPKNGHQKDTKIIFDGECKFDQQKILNWAPHGINHQEIHDHIGFTCQRSKICVGKGFLKIPKGWHVS